MIHYVRAIITGLLLGFFLGTTGCSEPSKAKPEYWQPTEYKVCSLGTTPSGLPNDLAFIVNRMDLPFGRYDALSSIKPYILHTDGTYNEVGSPINNKPLQTSITVSAWSPDGQSLYLNSRWEEPQWAMLEILNGDLSFNQDYYTGDIYRYDLNTTTFSNLTQSNAVSYFNNGAVLLPPSSIIFTAFVNDQNRPYVMNLDGSDKQPYSSAGGFTYGFHISPDNIQYSYHSDYQVYVGDVSNGNEVHVEAPCDFAFNPQWAPDSQHILFLCGPSDQTADIWIADRNGLNPKFIASRNGYDGQVALTNMYDFHGGTSDWIQWSGDHTIIFGAMDGSKVELYQTDINLSSIVQLTHSNIEDSHANFPSMSLDLKYFTYSSDKENRGKHDLYLYDLQTGEDNRITDVDIGCETRETYWRP